MSASQENVDVIVIGGGIAGISLAYEMSHDRTVVLLEMESSLAFHTTGRSAATFLETYGGPQIRALTTASRRFLESPPEFFEPTLLTPRALLQFARPSRGHVIEQLHADVLDLVPDAELIDGDAARDYFPLLNADAVERAIYEPGGMELDVAALHQGYVRGARLNQTDVLKSARVVSLSYAHEKWSATRADGSTFTAPVVINAAGAWADDVAALANVEKIGLTPLRRTIFMVASPRGEETKNLPMVGEIDHAFYLKPEGDQFLCSPADETVDVPGDARPDDLEIARAIDEINEATTIGARSVSSSWAGLRNFAPDRELVIGEAPSAPGFFWFAGQGGYGIQTAPAAARLAAALIRNEPVPTDLSERGLDPSALAPGRPALVGA